MKGKLLVLLLATSCVSFGQEFKKLSLEDSGIDFKNTITEDDTINGLSYLYLYNGGGVAIGDINNDGLEDIYFTGNQVEDKLYLNKGNLKFKDVTKKYFKNQRFDFHTGATMVDINNDGWLDIYVSAAGPAYDGEDRRNKLFINQKGKRFVDQANEYGLDDSLNTTQAAFFDADNDGDLDVYLLNHVYLRKNTQYFFQFNRMKKVEGNDRLMINEDGHFYDRSRELGIESTEYGQGVVVSDFNRDGRQDIYVCNDFEYGDKLFMNAGRAGFKQQILDKTMHTTLFSMGVDAADFNNDGLMDIMTVDMANADHVQSKKNMGGMSSEFFWSIVARGQHYQYMYNTLQMNVGDKFVDIAQMAGVSKTDWSWAPLFADFNNDGYQDLYVSNGYLRELRDADFTAAYDKGIQISKNFIPFEKLKKQIPSSKTINYIYRNTGDLGFEKKSVQWGLGEAINVNGAAFADLDNDGDLDLICNANNERSFILENELSDNNYLKVAVQGWGMNPQAFGTKIEVYQGEDVQLREVQPTRGFQSSMSSIIHFGIGQHEVIDSIVVRVNEVVVHQLFKVEANQTLTIDLSGVTNEQSLVYKKDKGVLTKVNVPGLNYKHTEAHYDDFEKEVLLPHQMSRLGPFITVDDINEDGLEDVYIGGARGSKGSLLVQKAGGRFEEKLLEPFKLNYLSEEMESIFFDADNDGDKDVYIVMGSNEEQAYHSSFQDQLYLNDGKEQFKIGTHLLPKDSISGQKVVAQDINNDGWMDLIVFGRQTPGAYPTPASSMIWLNEKGTFVDKTKEWAPDFVDLGMVTDAVFANVDEDKELEIVIVGEWMPVTVFDLVDGHYQNITDQKGLSKTVGWWNTIELYQDVDGKQQFVLGNLGLNNKFHPTIERPFHVYMNDFDDNGTNDIVLAKTQDEILYPVRGKECSTEQMPFVSQKFPSYDLFAKADVETIYTKEKLEAALHYEAHTFASSLLSIENGKMTLKELPSIYQTGPINAVVVGDFNDDESTDLFCLGNKFEAEVETVRYDGNPSIYLDGQLDWNGAEMLGVIENTKSAAVIHILNKPYLLLGVNNGQLQLYAVGQ